MDHFLVKNCSILLYPVLAVREQGDVLQENQGGEEFRLRPTLSPEFVDIFEVVSQFRVLFRWLCDSKHVTCKCN